MTHRVGWYGGALIQQGMHFSWPPHEGNMQLSGGEIYACYMDVFFFYHAKRKQDWFTGERNLAYLILRN